MTLIAFYIAAKPDPQIRHYIRPEFTDGQPTPNDRAHATRYASETEFRPVRLYFEQWGYDVYTEIVTE